jgi:hypothetical protein
MKKLNTIEQLGEINRNKTVEINLQGQVENETDISEDILSDMQSMLNIDENVCTLKDKPILFFDTNTTVLIIWFQTIIITGRFLSQFTFITI